MGQMAGDNVRTVVRQMNRHGVTLIEMLIVMAIITVLAGLGVVSMMGLGLSDSSKVKGDAKNLQQFLNIARMIAVGMDTSTVPVIVAFSATNRYYYAYIDRNGNGTLDAGEQTGLRLQMPDPRPGEPAITIGGVSARVVMLQDNVNYGTFSGTNVPVKQMESGINRNNEGTYWKGNGGTNIDTDGNDAGIQLAGGAMQTTFTKRGTATSGSIYLYLRKDEESTTSFHYTISINPNGKVNLYYWDKVRDDSGTTAYRWKMVG